MTILIAKIQACALYFQHESMRRVGQLHLTSIGADDMKQSLQPGISLVRRIPVGQERTISLMGEEGRVYATPYLIGDIEHTCRSLILEHAEPNEDSVGMEVAIKHLAPTLPGSTVEITATVTAVRSEEHTSEL